MTAEAQSTTGRDGSVFSSTRWNAVGRAGVAAIQFASVLVVYRLLSVDAVGLMAMARVATGLAEQLREMGSRHAIVQRESLDRSFLNGAFLLNCAIGVMLCAGVAASAPLLALFYEREDLTPVLQMLGLLFVIAPLGQVHRALLTREMSFQRIAGVDLMMALTTALVAIVMAWQGFGVWALVGGELAGMAASTVALWAARPWLPGLRTRRSDLAHMTRFGSNLVGFSLANYLFQNADRLIIGRALGAEALGLYAFAQRITLFPMRTISGVLVGVLIPSFSRMQDQPEKLRTRYLRALAGIAIITFPVLAGLACVAGMLVEVYDTRWAGAVWIIALLAPVGMVQSLTRTVGAIFLSQGRPDMLFKLGVGVGLATLVGYLMGAQWGLVGIAAGFATATLICASPTFAIAFGLIGERPANLLRTLRPIAAATAGAVMAMLGAQLALAEQGTWLRLGITGLLGTGLYWGVIFKLAPPALDDVRRMLMI